MSTIDPLSAQSGRTGSGKTGGSQELGQNQFLQLMIAQLKNQDPMKPADPSEFLGQLAQFSTVTGIQSMQDSLSGLADAMRSEQVLSGATLVGREVLAATQTLDYTAGSTVKGAVEAPEGTRSLKVAIKDSSGQLVRTFPLERQDGLTAFTWDGTTSTGAPAASGTYEIEIVADIGGTNYSLAPLVQSRVDSVTVDPRSRELTLNTVNGALALGNVRRVM